MTNMLRGAGYDVKHERNGPDGTVSCFFFMKARWYPREKLTVNRHRLEDGTDEHFSTRDYDHIIHLVRDPLKCIPSMHKVCGIGHQQWIKDHLNVHAAKGTPNWKLRWAMETWYKTNLKIESTLYRARLVRIEQVLKDWPREIETPPKVLHQHRSTGTRKSESVTWQQLYDVDETLTDKIVKQANSYGY